MSAGDITPRSIARNARNALDAYMLRGDAYECPICGNTARDLKSFHGRPGVMCPRCRALERHRAIWLYLTREAGIGSGPLRLLHVAPEPHIGSRLAAMPEIDYFSTDLGDLRATVQADLTDLPFEDRSFDLVLCCHVLEHIPDDRAAMREMRRVAPMSILQHPVDPNRETTYEDFSITDPEGRDRAFGQPDHVRLYGRDIANRLVESGFKIEIVDYSDRLSDAERTRFMTRSPHRALDGETIYVCHSL